MILLQANQIARYFGADTLFENIHLEVASKARIGLVGRNGAGKSTLLKIIANIEAPDAGQVIKNKQATLGYLAQDTGLDSTETIWNEMLKAFDKVRQMEARMRDVEVAIGETPESDSRYTSLLKEYDQLQHDFNEQNGYGYENEIRSVLHGFKFDESFYDKEISTLSGGQKTRLALARMLLVKPDILILDEPTSGLDPVSRDELLQILSEYIEDGEHSVLFSTHITGDLERAADYITYISYGELFFTGSKDEFVDMFRIVKGGMDELSADLQAKAVGVRTFPTGFEALVKTEDIGSFTALDIEPATIDEIVVFTSKKGEDYE